MTVVLRAITDENRDEVVALRVAPSQTRFVGTVADALADADEIPEGKGWYRAVYVDDVPVGFVMLSWDVVAAATHHRAVVPLEAAGRRGAPKPRLRP